MLHRLGLEDPAIVRAFRGFNAGAEAFRKASEFHEQRHPSR
jgi:hypothetical protein